jgi:hypothetical protein
MSLCEEIQHVWLRLCLSACQARRGCRQGSFPSMLTRCTCHATRGGDLLTVPPPCRPAGTTAAMVAKYRPVMPILTLVVPYLKRDGLKWKLEGRHAARQALLTSGLMPMLAAPTPSGEAHNGARQQRAG